MDFYVFLIILCCLPFSELFLLDTTTAGNGFIMTDKHYYRLLEMIAEESQTRSQSDGQMEQYVKQLQAEITDLKSRLASAQSDNKEMLNIKNETEMVKQENDRLQKEQITMQTNYNQLHQELLSLKNQMSAMNSELSVIKQMKGVHQLEELISLHNKSTGLEQAIKQTNSRVDMVVSDNNARKQDLYNKTKTIELNSARKFTEIEQNQTLYTESHAKELAEITNNLNVSLTNEDNNLKNELKILSRKINGTSAKLHESNEYVSMTACASANTYSPGAIVPFAANVHSNGLPKHGEYNNGVFTCQTKGLYMMFVSILSTSQNGNVGLYKNNNRIAYAYTSTNSDNYHYSGSGMAAVVLLKNDKLSIKALYDLLIEPHSCISIIKIK